MQMDKEQYGRAKASLIFSMQEGHSWQTAAASAGLQVSQSNAYRLWRAFRQHGETALSDGRHGHPSKLRGAVRAFLEERCRQAPQTPSSTIQMELQEHFDLSVSISQLNVSGRHLESATIPSTPSLEKKDGRGRRVPSTRVARRRA
jgi:transposase